MGTEIRRIEKEFVLSTVSDREISVKLSGNKAETDATISLFEEDTLHLSVDPEAAVNFATGGTVNVYFSYYGHVMTFISTVRSNQSGTIRIDTPETLYKNLSRKYSRVPAPNDSSVSFTIQDKKVELRFPRSEAYDPVEPPDFSDDFEPGNVETLIERFRDQTSRKANINEIIMFRDRKPSGFEEEMVAQTGKTFFIPSTDGRFPENDFQIGGRIITRAMLLQQEPHDGKVEGGIDRLPSLLAEKRERGISAELYSPILFHEYAIGYIHLAQEGEMHGAFDHDLLEYTHQFSKVLAFSLQINGYFKGAIPESGQYEGEIIDVSAAGLLFCHSSARLNELLPLYSDIDLLLRFGDRKIRIVVRLMRKYRSDDVNYFGLQFMEMKPEDFRFIFEFVYGRAIENDDENLWEGGADPPALDL